VRFEGSGERAAPIAPFVHAAYSYVHVTALDIEMMKVEQSPATREVLAEVLQRNVARIEEGYGTLQKDFQPGRNGREFMEGFYRMAYG